MSDRLLRLRALLDAHFALVVTVFVVIAAVGGWTIFSTYVDPGTDRVERTASSWETTSEFEHHAVVTEDNPMYPVDSTLSNRSVYFSEVSPRFEGEYRFSYRASDGGEIEADVEMAMVIRGLDEERGSDNVSVLWERTTDLESVSKKSVAPGESVGVPFSVNATEFANETRNIEESLGGPSDGTQVFLRATVVTTGSVNGRSVERTSTHRLPLVFKDGTYRVKNAGPKTESFERTETVARERSNGLLRSAGGPLLVLLGLGGLGGLAVAVRRDALALSSAERERLEYLDDRETFDEWISTIRLPPQAFELPKAEASSLGSLVDFAIDTDNAVVESPEEDAYYVVHDGYLYAYRPPGTATLDADQSVPESDVEGAPSDDDGLDPDVDVSGLSTAGDGEDGDSSRSGMAGGSVED